MAWLFYRTETDPVSPDGIFVKSGVSFRLYDGAGDTQPVGPVREGPKYITLQIWQDLYPELIAPGSIIVPGNEGDLRNYSIVLGIEPKIKSIDLRPKTNLSAHHTDLYQVEDASRFILRRGQPFDVTVQFEAGGINTTCDEFLFVAEHDFDAEPVMIQIPITTELPEEGWGAKLLGEPQVDAEGRRTYQVRLTTPHDAPVGAWTFGAAVKRDGTEVPAVIKNFPAAVVLLFNPWNEADDVYIASEAERIATVLRDSGAFYPFAAGVPSAKAWTFGQFNPVAIDVALDLLASMSATERANAFRVARHLVPLLNTQGPPRPPEAPVGMIEGRWPDLNTGTNPYAGGTNPNGMASSLEVLQHYASTSTSFKYGQCWVFACTGTTLLRSLGVPARPVSGTMIGRDVAAPFGTLELVLRRDTTTAKTVLVHTLKDTLWDFHVWTEAWFARPDRDDPQIAGGWQVIDATPQQPSVESSCFGLGPAPVAAIRNALAGPYDALAFQATIRDEPIFYMLAQNGVLAPTPVRTRPFLGRQILGESTGAIDQALDLFAAYKPSPSPLPGAHIEVELVGTPSLGDDLVVQVTIANNTSAALDAEVTLSWSPGSGGLVGPSAGSMGSLLTVPAASDLIELFTIPAAQYASWMSWSDQVVLSGVLMAAGGADCWDIDTTSISVPVPVVDVSLPLGESFLVGNQVQVTLAMTNPLDVAMTDVVFRLSTGNACVADEGAVVRHVVGQLAAGTTASHTFNLRARYPRLGDLLVGGVESPTLVVGSAAVVVSVAPCVADWNDDQIVDALDFFAFLDIFTLLDESADLTGASDPMDPAYGQPNGIVDTDDFFYFLDIFVIGCS